ncbi:cyclic peptide export ABC transporter [Burkholderia multivorans]|nr:cyclic peptide export ABC transporter [Burkholderia multivorans]
MTLFATSMGVLGGGCTAWLLATINDGLHVTGPMPIRLIETFMALCVVTLAGNAIAGMGNSIIGQKVVATLRKDISARIICAPIDSIERFRVYRMLATLNSDVETVSAFTFSFPGFAVAAAVTVGCVMYMVFLSPTLFLIALVAIVAGVLIRKHASARWNYYYQNVRGAQDELQKQYRAITEGAKELRINRNRRHRVWGAQLSGAADTIADFKIRAMRLFYATNAFGVTLFFLVIGLILLLKSRLEVDAQVLSGFVIVLLYVRGPVDQLANGLPALSQASISLQKIAELSAQFKNREMRLLAVSSEGTWNCTVHNLELRGVSYAFPKASDGTSFQLGPLDLRINHGQTVFVTGENGCGKTTLIKLLLGLYVPQEGQLLLNGRAVQTCELDEYRQLFSAVFSDYYLFDDLALSETTQLGRAKNYLELMEISHKVKIEGGAFSTIDLSTGQRKRLALIHAILEERPLMMFDEWAADQDPTFRHVFYTEFLPELKRQGKTLIVVSHDDRYFSVADQLIRLEAGQIIYSGSGSGFRYEHRRAKGDAHGRRL